MQSSGSLPGFKVPDFPEPDLGFPLRRSSAAKQTVGEALKGAYIAGGVQGYSVGQPVGYAAGHIAGVIEGSAVTAVCFGAIFFVSCVLLRFARR